MTSQGSKAKNWCFTLNNPEADEVKEAPAYDYLVIGKETGSEGTPHLQGYISLKTRCYLSALKKWLPRAHFEVMKGTPRQASDYCKKDGDFQEDGVLPEEQTKAATVKRKALYDEAYELAKQGKFDEIDKEIYIRHRGNLLAIHAESKEPPKTLDDETMAVWIHGATGVGKSKKAREDYPGAYYKMCNKWWDSYNDEQYVLIEDIDPDHCKYLAHHLKIWCDRYPFKAEYKGGSKDIRPKKIIITSNYTPQQCFNSIDLPPILRRCEIVSM